MRRLKGDWRSGFLSSAVHELQNFKGGRQSFEEANYGIMIRT